MLDSKQFLLNLNANTIKKITRPTQKCHNTFAFQSTSLGFRLELQYKPYSNCLQRQIFRVVGKILIDFCLSPVEKSSQIIRHREQNIQRGIYQKKKCKTAILLYCFHTAGVLHIFMLHNLLGPGISFYRKSKIIVKRKPNYEIGWFHN